MIDAAVVTESPLTEFSFTTTLSQMILHVVFFIFVVPFMSSVCESNAYPTVITNNSNRNSFNFRNSLHKQKMNYLFIYNQIRYNKNIIGGIL